MTSSEYVLSVQSWLVDLGLLTAAQDYWSEDSLNALKGAVYKSSAVDPQNLTVLRYAPEGYKFDALGILRKHEEVAIEEQPSINQTVDEDYSELVKVSVEAAKLIDSSIGSNEEPDIEETDTFQNEEEIQELPFVKAVREATEGEVKLDVDIADSAEDVVEKLEMPVYKPATVPKATVPVAAQHKPFKKRR